MALVETVADGHPLAALRSVRELRSETEQAEAGLVRQARTGGATNVEIAAALGVTKQDAYKKYGDRRFRGRS